MYILKHDDVDGYNSTWDKWRSKPTKEQLRETLEEFSNRGNIDQIVDDLFNTGQADVEDGSCTTFEIEHI